MKATHYINAIGGIKLYSKEKFASHGIKLSFIEPGNINYPQFNCPFVPDLSIIDVMMFNSKERIKEAGYPFRWPCCRGSEFLPSDYFSIGYWCN